MTHPAAHAFLALWNSISSPQLQPEYEAWHSFEHVPERVGLPGFIEARRYRAHTLSAEQAPRYFTCYWLTSPEALGTEQYRDVFTHPTPWSARMRTELRDFFRLPCTLSGAWGASTATQLATVHLRGDPARFAAHAQACLAPLVSQGKVVCAHWGTAVASEAFPIANQAPPSPQTPSADFVVMLQGMDHAALQEHTRQLVADFAPMATAASAPAYFELLTLVRQDELAPPAGARQAPWTDLFTTFQRGDTP